MVSGAFALAGAIPSGARPTRSDIFGALHIDYKLALNLIATAIFAVLLWLAARPGWRRGQVLPIGERQAEVHNSST